DEPSNTMLLWISISNFDKSGHLFGPDSMENIDLMYHIDAQIGDLITHIEERVGKGNALFMLTSDHGVAPIPELMQKRGYKNARRILTKDFLGQLNAHLEEAHDVSNLITRLKVPHLYFDMNMFKTFSAEKQKAIIQSIKEK